jgi:hypothetical protein
MCESYGFNCIVLVLGASEDLTKYQNTKNYKQTCSLYVCCIQDDVIISYAIVWNNSTILIYRVTIKEIDTFNVM